MFLVETPSQQGAEPEDHSPRLRGILGCQHGNRVQGVEQEVGAQLRSQGIEMRPRQLGLEPRAPARQLGRAHSLGRVQPPEVQGGKHADNHPVEKHTHEYAPHEGAGGVPHPWYRVMGRQPARREEGRQCNPNATIVSTGASAIEAAA